MQFGTAILIGILLAKSGLTTGQISIYEALLFVASMYCFFWIVGGQNALLQLYPKLKEEQKQKAIFNVFLLFSSFGLLTAAFLFFSKNIIVNHLVSFDKLPFLDLLAIFLALNCPTFLIQYYYLLLNKYKAIVFYGAASFLIQLIVVVVPIYLGMTLKEVMIGLVIWAGLKYVWALIMVLKYGKWKLDVSFFKIYFPLLLPLLLFAFINKGTEYISGLVVTSIFDDENAFAVFRYGAREFPIAVLLVGALATSLLPEVSANMEDGLAKIKAETRKISHWLYPLSILSMLCSPVIFPLVFNPDFKESAYIFNIFTLLLSSRILLPHIVTMGHQKNYALTASAIVEMVILLALSLWWGKQYGLYGIAFAAVVSFMVDRVILIVYNWRILKIPLNKYFDLKTYLIYNILLIIGFIVSFQI